MVTSTTSYGHGHGHELQQQCPKIINKANDDKIFSKLLSKENSSSIMTTNNNNNNNNNMNSSFRVYYGGSAGAAIPFMWESTPGTPKHTFPNSSLPPLTPPPSYHGFHSNSTKSSSSSSPSMKKHSKHNLLYTIFPRLNSRKKTHVSPLSSTVSSPSFSMSSSPSYSSSSSSNSINPNFRGKSFVSRPKSPIYFGFDHHDQEEHEKAFGSSSPTSTLCYGAKRRTNSDGLRGCFRWRM